MGEIKHTPASVPLRICYDYESEHDSIVLGGPDLTDVAEVFHSGLHTVSQTVHEARATAEKMVRAYNAHDDLLAALERVFSFVSYVNIHGVGSQPEPSGEPQPVRVSPEEFGRIFQEIGRVASAAIAAATSDDRAGDA